MKRVKSLSYSSHVSPFHRQDANPAPPPPLPTSPSLPPQPLKGSSSLLDLRSFSRRPGNLLRRFKSRDDELFGCAGEMLDIDERQMGARDSAAGQGPAIDEFPSPPRFSNAKSHSPATSISSGSEPLSPPPYCPPPRITSLQSRESLRALERQREEEAAANACITYIAAHSSPSSLSRPLPGPGPLCLDMNAVASYQRRRASSCASSCASSAFAGQSQASSRPSTNESLPSYRSVADSVASDLPSSERITFAGSPHTSFAARSASRPPGVSMTVTVPQTTTAAVASDVITKPRPYYFI
ncbi:BQ2448_6696 [Microbotryum intermedium]|uniref:BQ2448_6696 protein n=1 Tax=Microbotryum intermedium TaxID=269621 RepID=A0A238FQV4_9BASI|nr:BQ2448_6696 [Microbotryum intermedium]